MTWVTQNLFGIKLMVKRIVRIKFSNPLYIGYSEERGYSNKADVGGPELE